MRKKILLLLLIAAVYQPLCAQQMKVIYQNVVGGTGTDVATAVDKFPNDDYVVTGHTAGADSLFVPWKYDSPQAGWLAIYNNDGQRKQYKFFLNKFASDVKVLTDGGFIVCGYSFVTGAANQTWVARYDASVNLVWEKFYGGTDQEFGQKIIALADGNFMVASNAISSNGDVTGNHGGTDVWLMKLNASGNPIWNKCYGGSDYDNVNDIKIMPDGNCMVAATTSSNNGDISGLNGNYNAWVYKTNIANGSIMFSKLINDGTYLESICLYPIDNNTFWLAFRHPSGTTGQLNCNNRSSLLKMNLSGAYLNQVCQTNYGDCEYSCVIAGSNNTMLALGASSASFFLAPNDYSGDHVLINTINSQEQLVSHYEYGAAFDDQYVNGAVMLSDGKLVLATKSQGKGGDIMTNYSTAFQTSRLQDAWLPVVSANYNTVSGKIFYDFNDNGLYDVEDIGYATPVKAVKAINQTGTYTTSATGVFKLYTDTGNYSISFPFTDTNYVVKPGSATNTNYSTFGNTDSITARLIPRNDVSSSMVSFDSAYLGIKTRYQAKFRCNQVTNKDTVTLVLYKKPVQQYSPYNAGSATPSLITTDSIVWKYPISFRGGILNFSTDFYLSLPDTVPLLGDVSLCTNVRTKFADSLPGNNQFCLNQRALGQNKFITGTVIQLKADSNTIIGKKIANSVRYSFSSTQLDTVKAVVKLIKDSRFLLSSTQPPYSQINGDTLTWNFAKQPKNRVDTIRLSGIYPATSGILPGDTVRTITSFLPGTDTIPLLRMDTNKTVIRGQNSGILNPAVKIKSIGVTGVNQVARLQIKYNYQSILDTTGGLVKLIKTSKADFLYANPAPAFINDDTLTWAFKSPAATFSDSIEINLRLKGSPDVQQNDVLKEIAILQFTTFDTAVLFRKDSILHVVSFNCGLSDSNNSSLPAQQGLQWLRTFGGTADDFNTDITALSDSSVAVTGYSASHNIDLAGSAADYNGYVAKYLSSGKLLWKKIFGGSAYDKFNSVTAAQNGAVIAVGTTRSATGAFSTNHGQSDILAVKLDSSGNTIWQRQFGGSFTEDSATIKKMFNGNYVIACNSRSINGDRNYADSSGAGPWLFAINEAGTIVWQRSFRDTLLNKINEVVPINGKTLLLGGTRRIFDSTLGSYRTVGRMVKLDTLGNILFAKTFSPEGYDGAVTSMLQNDDSTYTFTGFVFPVNPSSASCAGDHGNHDAWLAKTDKNGNTIWQHFFGGAGDDDGNRIIKANNGGFFIAGAASYNSGNVTGVHASGQGASDAWLLKTDSSGALAWQKSIGGNNADYFTGITQMPANDLMLAGYSYSYNNGDIFNSIGAADAIVLKIGATNLIRGYVYVDNNNNNIKDNTDYFYNDGKVQSTKGSLISSSDLVNGYYANTVDSGSYNTLPVISSPYFDLLPQNTTSVFSGYLQSDSINFALVPTGAINDLVISAIPLAVARPGFAASYAIKYQNAGTTTINAGAVTFIKDNRSTIDSVSVPYSALTGDTIRWNFVSLTPQQQGSLKVYLKLKSPPALNNGDTLLMQTSISPMLNDTTVLNNLASVRQIVTGSFDPNDKTEIHGNEFPFAAAPAGDYLTYVIRFQNTGTDTAFMVSVRDTLESKLDWNSLEMIGASHPYTLSVKNGKNLEWKFSPIVLPDRNHNEPASHGYIAYRIKPVSSIIPGDTLKNTANIYFDFNLPVVTKPQLNKVVNGSIAFCPQTVISFDAGIMAGSYQWQENSGSGYIDIADGDHYSGTNTPALVITNAPGSFYGNRYRCRVNSTQFTAEKLLRFELKWTGAAGSNWEDPANWGCNVLPDAFTDVVIPGGLTNYPMVNNNITIRSISIRSGANVLVQQGKTVVLTGQK